MNNLLERIDREFGWLYRFPYVLLVTWYLKLKNRKLDNPDRYTEHQIDFFSIKALREKSDKFSGVRTEIASYAYDDGRSKRALDVGTGHGFQAKALFDIGVPKVVGVDLVPARIEFCSNLYKDTNISFQVMDAAWLAFPDKHFDCTTISAALHDMPSEIRCRVISEAVRVTKNVIVVFEPRTFKNPIAVWAYGTIGGILDESLNFKDYVKADLGELLIRNKLKVIKRKTVWSGIMSISVCRIIG